MEITPPPVPNMIVCASGEMMRVKMVNIGVWNMDLTIGVQVAHGLADKQKLVFCKAVIFTDDNSFVNNLDRPGSAVDPVMQGGVSHWDNAVMYLWRYTGGHFDQALYDDGVMNRGKVFIWYYL